MVEYKKQLKSKKEDLNKIEQDLSALFRRLGLNKQLDGYSTLALWQAAIDSIKDSSSIQLDIVRNKTYAHRLNSKMELVVAVQSASLANELQVLKPTLLLALQQACLSKGFKQIKALIFELH